jgi:hypothetical protein
MDVGAVVFVKVTLKVTGAPTAALEGTIGLVSVEAPSAEPAVRISIRSASGNAASRLARRPRVRRAVTPVMGREWDGRGFRAMVRRSWCPGTCARGQLSGGAAIYRPGGAVPTNAGATVLGLVTAGNGTGPVGAIRAPAGHRTRDLRPASRAHWPYWPRARSRKLLDNRVEAPARHPVRRVVTRRAPQGHAQQ